MPDLPQANHLCPTFNRNSCDKTPQLYNSCVFSTPSTPPNTFTMADQYQSGHQEVIPCLLSDYDDDVEAHRESFQAFMTRQAEEHWAAEISSLDIEGSADRIATVIEQEVNRLAKKLDVIATAMAAEADGTQANRLLAMIPTKLNLMARLEDLAFSRLQPVEGLAERPLAIEDVSPSTSQGSTQCEISGRLDGYDRHVSQTPIKKRSESPIKIESPTPTKRRRVNFSEDGASRVSEPTPALSHALHASSPSLPQALLTKGGNSSSGHQDPSPSPLLSQSKNAPAHHATPSNQRYDLSKAAPPSAKKKPAQTKKPAQASKPCHGKPLCISRANLHEVQHREWIFNFQSSGWINRRKNAIKAETNIDFLIQRAFEEAASTIRSSLIAKFTQTIYKQLPHLIASHLGPCLTDYEVEIQELGSRFVSIPGVPSVQNGECGGLKDRFKEVLRKVGNDIPRGYWASTGAVDGGDDGEGVIDVILVLSDYEKDTSQGNSGQGDDDAEEEPAGDVIKTTMRGVRHASTGRSGRGGGLAGEKTLGRRKPRLLVSGYAQTSQGRVERPAKRVGRPPTRHAREVGKDLEPHGGPEVEVVGEETIQAIVGSYVKPSGRMKEMAKMKSVRPLVDSLPA
ncbi:hypothetical protein QC764_403855 [Podospora pseudoanserina]|uniref:Uncharacterized protein n=1 Tax=Podospora pseudoanserina TaxID=2609844 RepID=A0ABR0I9N0_9PEZI|nr:hypothetical protein QC764_403855 [Podospora pseudoanserina]